MATRDVLLAVFRRIVSIYFREIEVVGAPPPETKSRLFAANHVNALIDPILVLTSAPFPIAPVAKSTLWKIPVLRWLLGVADAVPVVRKRDDPTKVAGSNDEVFDKVAAHFARGGNVLIFPEGTSHNEPHVLAPKTGPGRMLARAQALGTRDVTFQAVALEFDARDKFRSRALLVFGPVRSVDALSLEGEALIAKITETIADDLSELVVEGTTWDDRILITRVAEMLAHEDGDRSLAKWNSIGRQVEAARKTLGDQNHSLYRDVAGAVSDYYRLLGETGVTEEQVARGGVQLDPRRVLRGTLLVLVLPLALVGGVAYFVPYQVPKLASRLAKGDVDEISTLKLGLGLAVHPIWMAILIALSFVFLRFPLSLAAAAIAMSAPFAALAWLDRFDRLRSAWAVLPMRGGNARLATLREARTRALERIQSARAKIDQTSEASIDRVE